MCVYPVLRQLCLAGQRASGRVGADGQIALSWATGLALEGGLYLAALEQIGFGHSWPRPLARLSHLCWRMDYRSHEQKEGTVIDSTDPDLLWAWTAGLCLVNFSQFRFNQENTR